MCCKNEITNNTGSTKAAKTPSQSICSMGFGNKNNDALVVHRGNGGPNAQCLTCGSFFPWGYSCPGCKK